MTVPDKCFFTAGGNRNIIYRGEKLKAANGGYHYKISWDHQPPHTQEAGHTTFGMRSVEGAFADGTWRVINKADNNEEALFLLNKDE